MPEAELTQGPMSSGEGGTLRVLRGGSFTTGAEALRCANRAAYDPDRFDVNIGFRCVVPCPQVRTDSGADLLGPQVRTDSGADLPGAAAPPRGISPGSGAR